MNVCKKNNKVLSKNDTFATVSDGNLRFQQVTVRYYVLLHKVRVAQSREQVP